MALALALASAAPLAGCADAPSIAAPVAADPRNIWGGATDADTLEANSVVWVNGCTGTLITPRIVLTAAHCLDPGSLPTVRLGASQAGWDEEHTVQAVRVLPYPGYNKGIEGAEHPAALDAQLVWLERPILHQAKIRRPSLTPPANPSVGGVGMAGWSACGPIIDEWDPNVTTRQAVTWRDGVYHGPAGAAPLSLQNLAGPVGRTWYRDGVDVGVCFGDSGGPLFVAGADLTREVIGVLALLWYDGERRAVASAWADITAEPLRSWIVQNVLDRNNGGHSDAWLAAHGKDRATYWYGETDYTGACDEVRDPDCDTWYSEHDDAPDVYDPEQPDRDPLPAAGPCGGLCLDPVAMTNPWALASGHLGSAATCHETALPVRGMACGGLGAGRTLSVNGTVVDCASPGLPAPREGGYCIQTSVGPFDWAWFQLW